MPGNVYFFGPAAFGAPAVTSCFIPPGVTSIQVECFGSTSQYSNVPASMGPQQGVYNGASYSKSTTISVTPGQIVYFNVGSVGGNTWFNKNANSVPVVGTNTSATSCLAVSGNTAAASQVAANIGNVRYAGGAGRANTGTVASAVGGNAGPNGPGAATGTPYTNTTYSGYTWDQGGGSNGGSSGSLGVPSYGRSGSGTAGAGSYYLNGSGFTNGTIDNFVQYQYINNFVTQYSASGLPYTGVFGGSIVKYNPGCCGTDSWDIYGTSGLIIITIIDTTQKSIVYFGGTYPTYTGSFTVPADFGSLISMEAFGCGGLPASYSSATGGGGGGGGAYSKTLGASVTASIVAGSTIVYFQTGGIYNNSIQGGNPWARIGTNSTPTAVTDGVLALNGNTATTNTGATGGAAASGVGNTKFSGGTGGTGYTSSRYADGGGGGGAGPLGNGANGGASTNAAYPNSSGGGGGGSNGGVAGNPGSGGTGGNGGASGVSGSTGGAGAPLNTSPGSGTLGGGSGGAGGANSYGYTTIASVYHNGIYGIQGGQGGGSGSVGQIAGYSQGGGGTAQNINFGVQYYQNASGGVVFTYVPNTDVTAALTGALSSGSTGTLTTSQTLTQALSGRTASASTGTLTNSQALTKALSGVLVSAFAGNVGQSTDQIVGLDSALAAALAGTLTNSQESTRALTGVLASGQTSSFPAYIEMVGAQASGQTGSFDYRNTGWKTINTDGSDIWIDVNTQP